MKFETLLPYEISEKYVDSSKRLRLASILTIAQDIATYAAEVDLGLTHEKTRDRGLLWVVARYHFEIERLPELNETVDVLSWQSRMMVMFFMRNFQFLDKDGHPFIKGISAWSLIDANSRQVIMPKDYGLDAPDHIRGDELPRPGALRLQPGEFKTTIRCNEEDMDSNKHMNNVVYLDKCVSLIPESYLQSHNPKSFDINYKKELRLGEETELTYSIKDDECSFDAGTFALLIRFDKAL